MKRRDAILLPLLCVPSFARFAVPVCLRAGAHLLYRAKISLIDALLGFWRRLTLPDGMRVPIIHDQARQKNV